MYHFLRDFFNDCVNSWMIVDLQEMTSDIAPPEAKRPKKDAVMLLNIQNARVVQDARFVGQEDSLVHQADCAGLQDARFVIKNSFTLDLI